MIANEDRILGAVLISPPVGPGLATLRNLEALRLALQCDQVQVANLLAIRTRSVEDITDAGLHESGWLETRPALDAMLNVSTDIVLAWGLGGGFTGPARVHFNAQVSWIYERLENPERSARIWTVGPAPRHPSRWHQYVSDRHERTPPGSFEDRLKHVLVRRDQGFDADAEGLRLLHV